MTLPTNTHSDTDCQQPSACPSCGSESIEGGFVEIDSTIAWQDVSCLDCQGPSWREYYTYAGHVLLTEADGIL